MPSGMLGPRAEKLETTSSRRPTVPWSSVEPTVITHGSSAGLATLPLLGPWLPADTTTVRPAAHARSTAKFTGSTRYESGEYVRSDRLTTSIRYASLLASTQP